MSRKDTIIVAILINTGLLAVLFMMAVQTEDFGISFQPNQEVVEIVKPPQRETAAQVYFAPQSPSHESDSIPALQNHTIQSFPSQRESQEDLDLSHAALSTALEEEGPYVEVTVKRGDYLEKIAKANGTTVQAILKVNRLPSPLLSIGQVLRIPLREEPVQMLVKAEKQEIALSDPQYYTLKSGDNPWKVAKQFHVGFNELLKMNQLDEGKARNLKPGDVLRVK